MSRQLENWMASNEVREVRKRESGMGWSVVLFDHHVGVGKSVEAALDHAKEMRARWFASRGLKEAV